MSSHDLSYTYDQAGQVSVKWNPTLRVTYSYDPNGNTTLENSGGSLTTYSWDYENRPTLVQLAGGGVTTATYVGDGKRRRYEDVSTEQLRDFYWDGGSILFQKNVNGMTDRVYTYRPEEYGEVLSEGLAAPNHWFHHYDSQGSTAELTDPSQTTAVSYVYRAFGEPTVVSGSNPSRMTWLGKLGYYWQPNTSDYWVRARVYNPTNARWLSRDPAQSDANLYAYLTNPLVAMDPSGLQIDTCHPAEQLQAWYHEVVPEVEEKKERLRKALRYSGCMAKCEAEKATDWFGMAKDKAIEWGLHHLGKWGKRLAPGYGYYCTARDIIDCHKKCMREVYGKS